MKRISVYLTILCSVIFFSCSDDEELTTDDTENGTALNDFSAELQTILSADELSSTVDNVLGQLFVDNGQTNKAATNDCYSAEYTDSGFSATFNNCVLNGTENINGTLNILYSFGENQNEFTATFTDFFVGSTVINGSRRFTLNATDLEEQLTFTIASNLTIEFENGTTISESGDKTFGFLFEEGEDTLWNLSGNWTVTVDNDTYVIGGNVSKPLTCEFWSAGSMAISKNGLDLEVNFGDGTCDDQATLTYPDGTMETLTLQ